MIIYRDRVCIAMTLNAQESQYNQYQDYTFAEEATSNDLFM